MSDYWVIRPNDSFTWAKIEAFFAKSVQDAEDDNDPMIRPQQLQFLRAMLGAHLCSVTTPRQRRLRKTRKNK